MESNTEKYLQSPEGTRESALATPAAKMLRLAGYELTPLPEAEMDAYNYSVLSEGKVLPESGFSRVKRESSNYPLHHQFEATKTIVGKSGQTHEIKIIFHPVHLNSKNPVSTIGIFLDKQRIQGNHDANLGEMRQMLALVESMATLEVSADRLPSSDAKRKKIEDQLHSYYNEVLPNEEK